MTVPLNPLMVPDLYCYRCGCKLRVVVGVEFKQVIARAYCDSETCKYGFRLSPDHANGSIQGEKYIAPEGTNA